MSERELSPWELTDEEIKAAVKGTWIDLETGNAGVGVQVPSFESLKSVATAAVEKYREHLASQVGPDPCVGCEHKEHCNRKDGIWKDEPLIQDVCELIAAYEGQQAGYAKGIQERGKQ